MFKSRPDCYFYAKEFKPTETRGKEFDIALLKGLLHHLGDEEVCSLLSDVNKVLAPNALVLAIDPVFLPKQNIISRFLLSMIEGKTCAQPLNIKHFSKISSQLISQKFCIRISSHTTVTLSSVENPETKDNSLTKLIKWISVGTNNLKKVFLSLTKSILQFTKYNLIGAFRSAFTFSFYAVLVTFGLHPVLALTLTF